MDDGILMVASAVRGRWAMRPLNLGPGIRPAPQVTEKSLVDYVSEGYPPGGFLTAVLSNDLAGAVTRADDENRDALVGITALVVERLPSACWGSRQIVAEWLAAHETLRSQTEQEKAS